MRIPSGDLAPARRHHARRGRGLPVLLALVLVAGVAAGAYALRRDDHRAPGRVAGASSCPTARATSAATPKPAPRATVLPARRVPLPAPSKVKVLLLNGTARNGLGRTVGNQLAKRGFKVVGTGNAPRQLAGVSRVSYGPGAEAAAQLVATHVLGAQVVAAPKAARGSVVLVLGSAFRRVRTVAEARSAAGHVLAVVPAAVVPAAPARTAAPAASPTACR